MRQELINKVPQCSVCHIDEVWWEEEGMYICPVWLKAIKRLRGEK